MFGMRLQFSLVDVRDRTYDVHQGWVIMKQSNKRRNKRLVLNQPKPKKAQRVLEAPTETKPVQRALDLVITENERNHLAWAATEKLLNSRVRVRDVFGRLKD
jgi:hypothetical protein